MRLQFECSRWAAVLALWGAAFPCPTAAQEKDTAVTSGGGSCERAKQKLGPDRPSSDKQQGLVTMQRCGEAGVATLVSYWRQPAIDTVLLPALVEGSARLNDRRVYHAARAIVIDPTRSEAVRLGALTVLVAGFDPDIYVSFNTPTKPMYSSYVGIGRVVHTSKRSAPQPVGAEAKDDLISLLKLLAASDPNERMRKVAGELGPLLEQRRGR